MLHDEIFNTENENSENSAAENTYGGDITDSENDVCHKDALSGKESVPVAAETEYTACGAAADTAAGNVCSESIPSGAADDTISEYAANDTHDAAPDGDDENIQNDDTENFASMLEDYLPTPENTDKLKKPMPQWLKNAAVSFGACAVMLLIYSFLIVPHIKPSAVISYNSAPVSGNAENVAAVRAAAEKILPSVVSVSAKSSYRSFFGVSTQTANGTGIIISSNGYILTGCSLIGSGDEATVTINKTNYAANVVAQDTSKDIAILHIDAENLPAAQFGNSDDIHAGDPVIAVGNILGSEMGASVTRGIICGVNSNLALQNGNTINLLQTDAITDSGSTGGCIVNENGDIIGMITSAISSNSEKISFAIPSNDIKSLAETQTGSKSGAASSGLIIGITGSDADHGVTVESVIEGSPAQKSGIAVGDLILKVDGTPVKSIAEINKIKDTHKAGDTLIITVYHNGEITDINVVL